jgi:hypothetical protein
LYACTDLRFSSAKLKVDSTRQVLLEIAVTDAAIAVDWTTARPTSLVPDDLIAEAPDSAQYAAVPKAATKASSYTKWTHELKSWLVDQEALELYKSASGEVSRPGESLREFQARLALSAREGRDSAMLKLREKYADKRSTLADKVERARLAVERESSEAGAARLDTAISVGTTIAGVLLGGRSRRRGTSAVRSAGRARKQGQDVAHARDALRSAEAALADFDAKVEAELFKLQTGGGAEAIETVVVKPKRDGVNVRLLALVWKPAE